MRRGEFRGLDAAAQLQTWQQRATDTRPAIGTGWEELDSMLHRGGFSPGTTVLLGGRPHTRKTTVILNVVANLLKSGTPVGFVGLDEPTPDYVAKLASVFSRVPHAKLEEEWDSPITERMREEYREYASRLSLTTGVRPSFEMLTGWLEIAEFDCGERPRFVVVDYVSKLGVASDGRGNVDRILGLMEDLSVWAEEQEIVVVGLHHVGRMDDFSSGRYHGATPLSLESLKYGGEEVADVVLGTFRPALDPLGNMNRQQAQRALKDKFDEEDWGDAVAMVQQYRHSTFVQLLKNRPGVHLSPQGFEVKSNSESLFLEPRETE